MQLKRLFSTESVKGTKDYLNTQKKYELIRTALYFAISVSLFVAGYIPDAPKDEPAHRRGRTGLSSRQQKRCGGNHVPALS